MLKGNIKEKSSNTDAKHHHRKASVLNWYEERFLKSSVFVTD